MPTEGELERWHGLYGNMTQDMRDALESRNAKKDFPELTDEEIIRGNKLIAKFMGADTGGRIDKVWKYDVPNHIWAAEGLRYHKNWNWLMPVMHKIGQEYNVKITWNADGGSKGFDCTWIERPDVFDKTLASFGGFGPITNTWKCVVKFIEWYNLKHKRSTDKSALPSK